MDFKRTIMRTNDRYDRYGPFFENAHPNDTETLMCSGRTLAVISMLTLLITVGTFLNASRTLVDVFNKKSNDIEVCLPHELLKGNITNYLTKDHKNDEFVYCAYTHKKIHLIIDNMANEYASKVAKRLSDILMHGRAISAHVFFSGSDKDSDKIEVTFERRWSLSHFEGFKLGDRRIVVTAKGTYYVYSQVFYKLIPDGPGGVWTKLQQFHLNHEISMYRITVPSHGGKRDLLKNHNIILVNGSVAYFKSSFVSGIFELESGDEISVSVTYPYRISRRKEYNFIGMLMLG